MDYRIHPINGNRSIPAIEVFSKALKYLKDKLIDFIVNKIEGLGIRDSKDIKWVLTVPAIWKPGARHFMREAAYRVRIITEWFSETCNLRTKKRHIDQNIRLSVWVSQSDSPMRREQLTSLNRSVIIVKQ